MSFPQHSEPLLSDDSFGDVYTEEEKLENQTYGAPIPAQSKWSRKGLAFVVSLLLVAAMFLVAGTSAWASSSKPEVQKVAAASSAEEFISQAARAVGDTYLIGVGKADITG